MVVTTKEQQIWNWWQRRKHIIFNSSEEIVINFSDTEGIFSILWNWCPSIHAYARTYAVRDVRHCHVSMLPNRIQRGDATTAWSSSADQLVLLDGSGRPGPARTCTSFCSIGSQLFDARLKMYSKPAVQWPCTKPRFLAQPKQKQDLPGPAQTDSLGLASRGPATGRTGDRFRNERTFSIFFP